MTNMTLREEVLKVDRRGRVRTPKERRESLLDEFERSGMSGAGFARHYGINYATFADWVQKRRKQRSEQAQVTGKAELPPLSDSAPRWLEAVVENPVEESKLPSSRSGSPLAVHLPGGGKMAVSDAGQIALAAELLKALRVGS